MGSPCRKGTSRFPSGMFLQAAEEMAAHIDGNDIMFTMGGAFLASSQWCPGQRIAWHLQRAVCFLLGSVSLCSCPLSPAGLVSVPNACLSCCRLHASRCVIFISGDFDWVHPFVWFRNLDKLIHHANLVTQSATHSWSCQASSPPQELR